jgi:hypothetical protein
VAARQVAAQQGNMELDAPPVTCGPKGMGRGSIVKEQTPVYGIARNRLKRLGLCHLANLSKLTAGS